ncbi:MAG TPA: BON domain-containing protein [Polyangiaceae bacterium]|nr:BON domain-containing protein [Polyangiaceae bacterium]
MKFTIFIVLAVAATACERSERPGSEATELDSAGRSATEISKAAADNTKVNERDRNADTLTPGDQGESDADRTITQRVRQAVVARDGLSVTAQNVKIITIDGVVTLRGPVKDAQERSTIAALAQGVDGVKRVDNQLEIAAR